MSDLTTTLEQQRANSQDWPQALRLSAARDSLATVLYYARCEAWSVPGRHWDALPPRVRDLYRGKALEILHQLKPQPRGADGSDLARAVFDLGVALNRAKAAELSDKVVGTITPEEP